MSNIESFSELFFTQVENIAHQYQYDFVYEPEGEGDVYIGQVVKRDTDGAIIGTPLSFRVKIDETYLSGNIRFFNQQGEFKQDIFRVDDGLIEVLTFIDNRLALNFS